MLKLDETPTIGPIGPRRDGLDVPFWDGLALGELRIQRCTTCRTWWWAPVWRCAGCGSWDLGWEATPARGTVYSWIRTHQAFAPEMQPVVPYVSLLVELDEAGARRLMGILVGDETGLDIGSEVRGVIQQPSDLTNHRHVLRWELVR